MCRTWFHLHKISNAVNCQSTMSSCFCSHTLRNVALHRRSNAKTGQLAAICSIVWLQAAYRLDTPQLHVNESHVFKLMRGHLTWLQQLQRTAAVEGRPCCIVVRDDLDELAVEFDGLGEGTGLANGLNEQVQLVSSALHRKEAGEPAL